MITRRTLMAAGTSVALASLLANRSALAREQSVEDVLFDKDAPVIGNPDGDVTIVEYFDYQCGYCKRGHPDVMKVVAEDGNVRLVMKDWPIFGANSVFAAQAALGAAEIGEYQPAMEALISAQSRLTPDEAGKLLVEAGIDMQAVTKAVNANSKKIGALLSRNNEQATELGFRGTPSFIIGRYAYGGMLEADQLREAIKRARA